MAKYFKIVGIISIIGSVLASITSLIVVIQTASDISATWGLSLTSFLLITLMGPASGALFLSYGYDLEQRNNDRNKNLKKKIYEKTQPNHKDEPIVYQDLKSPVKKVITKLYQCYDVQGNYLELTPGTWVYVLAESEKYQKRKISVENFDKVVVVESVPISIFLN